MSSFCLQAGFLFTKPKVISLLQQGEDPWQVEKEGPRYFSLGECLGLAVFAGPSVANKERAQLRVWVEKCLQVLSL